MVDWLYALPPQAELDGVLYVHGSPLSDVESFKAAAGSRRRSACWPACTTGRSSSGTATCSSAGPGPADVELLNPGSVGMPLDGDTRSAWAVRTDDGEFEFRRTAYDNQRAADAYRKLGGDFGEFAARRLERGSD